MQDLSGKVAFITGAGRGQGRSHAAHLADLGADIVAVDICADIASVPYPLATENDLALTAKEVEARGRRVLTRKADVRDRDQLQHAFDVAVEEFGGIDIVIANAGVAPLSVRPTETEWQDVIDVNLTGAYNTVQVAAPIMVKRQQGGSIVLVSSTAGLNGIAVDTPGGLGYTAAKHGLVGLMRAYANILGAQNIRVNTVHPTGVSTPMIVNAAVEELIGDNTSMAGTFANALPVEMIDSIDISYAIGWLVSDEGRYVTGVTLPVDAGYTNKR